MTAALQPAIKYEAARLFDYITRRAWPHDSVGKAYETEPERYQEFH